MRVRLPSCLLVAIALTGAPAATAAGATRQLRTPTIQEMRIATIVDAASGRATEYFSFFRDLTAEETKTVEQFRSSGEVSKRRTIVSDLIVYRSVLDNGSIAEYRDVKSVDGTPVAGREERVRALFAKQGRAASVRDELRHINAEGSRYDLDYTIAGLTMSQGLPLQPWARALFEFQTDGTEVVDGRETLVLSYRQVVPNDRFGFRLSLPSDLKAGPPLFRGRVWLDPASSRLVREVREVVVQAQGSDRPIVVQRYEFRFAPSRFEVLLPRTIVFSSLTHFSRSDAGVTSALKYRLTFAYGEFRRFTATSDDTELADAATNPDASPGGESAAPPEVATRDDAPPAVAVPEPVATADLGPEFGPDAPMGPPDAETRPAAPPGESPASTSAVSPDPPPPAAARPTPVRTSAPATSPVAAPAAAPAVRPASQPRVRRLSAPPRPASSGLPVSAALMLPVPPLPRIGIPVPDAPAIPDPPPPLAPGERPRLRPPPS